MTVHKTDIYRWSVAAASFVDVWRVRIDSTVTLGRNAHLMVFKCLWCACKCRVVTGSTPVWLRTDPRTLASVYEDSSALATVVCEIKASAAYLVFMQNLLYSLCSLGLRCVCLYRSFFFLIGYPGLKILLSIDLCMACLALRFFPP